MSRKSDNNTYTSCCCCQGVRWGVVYLCINFVSMHCVIYKLRYFSIHRWLLVITRQWSVVLHWWNSSTLPGKIQGTRASIYSNFEVKKGKKENKFLSVLYFLQQISRKMVCTKLDKNRFYNEVHFIVTFHFSVIYFFLIKSVFIV